MYDVHNADKPIPYRMTRWQKLSWVLANVATTAALLITVLYFVLVYPYADDNHHINYPNFFMHGMNVMVMYLDLFVSGMTKILFGTE